MYNNSRVSSEFKGFGPLKHSCNLKGIGYCSYSKR